MLLQGVWACFTRAFEVLLMRCGSASPRDLGVAAPRVVGPLLPRRAGALPWVYGVLLEGGGEGTFHQWCGVLLEGNTVQQQTGLRVRETMPKQTALTTQ